jgi:fatty aldehyde decarbonylase
MTPRHSAAPAPGLDPSSPAYRDAYSRINGVVVVGEGLADRHFRLLARAIPEDGAELLRLGAMEGRHARDFIGCGANLGVRPDAALAKRLFAPLHGLFRACERTGDLAGCLVIQCLIVECFAVAAYRAYLPVADPYAQPITAAVLADEAEHRNYGEHWLQGRFAEVAEAVAAICRRALPVTLQILQAVAADMRVIGMDPADLVGCFCELFEQSLVTIGFSGAEARRLVFRSVAAVPLG